MRQVLSKIVGVVDPRVENEIEEPHIQVKVDVDAAGRLGLKPGDVRRSAATVFSGIEVGYLFEEQKVFEVVVWSAPRSATASTASATISSRRRTAITCASPGSRTSGSSRPRP